MDAVLAGGGDVGRQMRAIDWSRTGLGPMEGWKQSLRSALSICLSSRFPIVMYWGPEFTVLYNDAYSRILGAKHPWALGQPCCVCWSEIWDTIGPMLDEVVATGEATWSDDLELMLERHGAPEECYFSFSFSPVRVEDGSVGGVFTAVVETTHRVQSERRLRLLTHLGEHSVGARSSEEACRRCIEAMGDTRVMPFALLYLCDESGTPKLVGQTGLSSDRISALEEDPAAPWPAAELRRTGRPVLVTLEPGYLHPAERWPRDGAPGQAMVLPIGPTETTQASGFLVAGVDPHQPLDADHQAFFELMAKQVSGAVADAQAYEGERRRAEALFELDRAKTEFFSNVSHEFRTPLTLLVGPLESLLEQAEPGSLEAQELDLARRNALRLLKLVNTLLDFSRIDAIRKEAAFEPVDLAECTEDLASVFRSATERAGLRLVVECPPMDQLTSIDREIWEKVVLNLLSNALKFTMAGQITVRVEKIGDQAVLTVQDTGSGISEDTLPHIFDRFYRVRDAESRTHEGAGIGLALVKELVGIMGGDIEVSSTLGEGTTFRVAVPLAGSERALEPRQRTGPAASPGVIRSTYVAEAMGWLPVAVEPSARPGHDPHQQSSRALRVLLVDDNADMRAYLERILAAHWEVEAAADGVQAMDAIRRMRPDLVLTDGMMPGIDGFELVSAIRDDPALRDLPVIMLSARAGEESSVEGLYRGADDYLVKPFTVQELLARVSANLGLAGMRNELAQVRAEAQLAGDRAAFLNMAAHELRTPLTVIGGYVALILGGALEWGSDQAREALEKVAFKTKEGVRLVEQMLMAARMESGAILVNRSSFDLRDLAQHAVDRVSELAALESQQVVAIAPDRPVMVSVDGTLVSLILDNLVTNAVFHGASPITVEVMAEPPRVRVVDTGAGVADEVRDKIFEPFFQVEDDLRPRRGAGLGLAVSRRLADLHGGSLVLDQSEQGASFILSLPEARGLPQLAARDLEAG